MRQVCVFVSVFSFLILFTACGTYRMKTDMLQDQIQQNDYASALQTVDNNKFLNKKRNELLLYLEKGKLAHLNNNYVLSNEYFNKADDLIDQNRLALGGKVLGVVSNPEQEFYKGEDFEKVAIHYYKALNYIFLQDIDEALVEARRITLQLQRINEKYPAGKKNRYTNDTFALTLQGLLYESSGDINNAFVAYRNAIDIYIANGGDYFGVAIPQQLKKDFFRTADIMGFENEIIHYEKLLEFTYERTTPKPANEVIVFWENGLVPYKDETSFMFTVLPKSDTNVFSIYNEELDLLIPLPNLSNDNNDDLDIFRVAFPRYVKRESFYRKGSVQIDSVQYPFQLTESYEHIAFKTLKDRTYREIGNVAIRLATKKTSEYILKNQNEVAGTILGIFNAITEGADTRNWQTLPEQIHYTRIPLPKKQQNLEVILEDRYQNKVKKVVPVPNSGKLSFTRLSTPELL
ncbi:hypothetical protein M0D21_19185 [Aquimarina sp. D1M17]|uniref:COG3014 family protein n=1 Tax=Aquimarina acroporae TaxID=2937283 RepID=UPI0020C008BE|nr:hypothetical protein [Aquimarina acroporae]MCK8523715.1 hypothetical protein [Aquimarina acroporae]